MEKEGIKYDNGKPRLAEMIVDFKESLLEVCKVWEFGANKYEKSNWKKVENGADRYTNAMLRHLVAEADSPVDKESELRHAAHVAWNALARLKFLLESEELQEPKRTSRRSCLFTDEDRLELFSNARANLGKGRLEYVGQCPYNRRKRDVK